MAENFIISGDDGYIRAKEEKKIRDKFLSSNEVELNFRAYNPDEFAQAIDDAGTAPFLADKRVTVIRGIESLKEECFPALISYLKKPNPTSVLILTSDAEFKKTARYKEISRGLAEISADQLTPYKIKEGIRAFFKKENISVSPQAVDLIFELKGSDPGSIINELEKLAAFSGGDEINAAHVEEMVGRSVSETVYKLVDAINLKNAKAAFNILEDLFTQKKQAPEIIGYLAWYIRTVQKIKLLSLEGLARNEIIATAGRGAYRVFNEAGRYSASKVSKWLNALVEADIDVKTGRKEPFLALEMLVITLIGA